MESVCRGNPTVGSNPTLSATFSLQATKLKDLSFGSGSGPTGRWNATLARSQASSRGATASWNGTAELAHAAAPPRGGTESSAGADAVEQPGPHGDRGHGQPGSVRARHGPSYPAETIDCLMQDADVEEAAWMFEEVTGKPLKPTAAH